MSKGLKGTVVNRVMPSLQGGSLEMKSLQVTAPFKAVYPGA